METFDLTPETPQSPICLLTIEFPILFNSITEDEQAEEGDTVVLLNDQEQEYVPIGAVDELVDILQNADLEAEGEEARKLSERYVLYHAPPNTPSPETTPLVDEGVTDVPFEVNEMECVICSETVAYEGNAVVIDAIEYNQFLHVDCVDEFCEVLERVWDASEELLAECI